MFKITYREIYSSFYTKVKAYDLAALVEDQAKEMMKEWLHTVLASPRVMKFFQTIDIDDESAQLTIQMNRSTGSDVADKYYIKDVLATGVAKEWIMPKYNSALNAAQVFGGKEMSWFSQANHITAVKQMMSDLESKWAKLIRDYGVWHNEYISE